ncbi:MAG: cytochrome c oxidase accessory protein CcoG [Candidatus Jidaibacter sp.]|nr:cytochrome c oxidase accessory protein CcoG [Candidatus Jidaibacter sp.]
MIYPQNVTGKYRSIKNYSSLALLLLYFLCSWIRWPRGAGEPDQALLMDLVNRRVYIFNIEIWPDELYYLTGLLILAALGLFFVTSLFGRVWCGYTCPHTVFVDLFNKVEAFFQGDRNARIKLDSEPMTQDKFIKKMATHLSWVSIAFAFAFGWVCYFYDAPSLVLDLWNGKITSGGLAWLSGLTLSTYLFAGFVRDKVCVYMCPYGRFQSAMLDNDTTIVTYHDWRGEPRGKRDANSKSGDCIDCGRCVFVCPMGIDIRNGLQISCIGCGLCVDACNSVMDKLGRPLNLIGYDSINSSADKMNGVPHAKKLLHPKTLLFGGLFVLVMFLLFYALSNKQEVKIASIHDRNVMFTFLPDGSVRNSYILKIANRTLQKQQIALLVVGIEGATLKLQGFEQDYDTEHKLTLDPDQEIELIAFVKATKEMLKSSKNPISFQVRSDYYDKVFITNSVFIKEQ